MSRVLILLIFLVSQSLGYSQQIKPLQFREEVFDFGDVSEDGGPVTHEFTFLNTTNRPIKILTVQASCGCTTPGWSKEAVSPGKTGFIQARFDPKGRPGYFSKSLTVTTDYDAAPVILQIKGEVSTPDTADELRVSKGGWGLKVSSFNLGKVYIKDEAAVKEFPVVNKGDKTITVLDIVGPPYIKATVEPLALKPGEFGSIKIDYHGKQKAMYGFQSDNIEFHTDDETMPVKSFSVYATLEDDFSKLTAEDLAVAPQLKIAETSLDFGKIQQGQRAEREVIITNNGKKELILKSLQGNCSCVTATSSKNALKAGESATIKIAFNSSERKGSQQKAVTIYSNDPRNPVQRVTFSAYVDN